MPIDACSQPDERCAASRHFEFFWYPGRDLAETKTLQPTALPPEAAAGKKYERIGWSHEILPSERTLRFVEMEYALPAAAGPDCFRAVRERMRSRHAEVAWPVEYRCLRSDDAWLSPRTDAKTVALAPPGRGAVARTLRISSPSASARRTPALGKRHSLGAERRRAVSALRRVPAAAPISTRRAFPERAPAACSAPERAGRPRMPSAAWFDRSAPWS
jgi:hypothetical protein